MRKTCYYCGKKPSAGKVKSRKGQYKAKGGTGSKVSRRTNRLFFPNLQRTKANIDGRVLTIHVCTKCLKAGKVKKA